MLISEWFKKNKTEYNSDDKGKSGAKKSIPDGVWVKCDDCGEIIYQKELERNMMVCPSCSYHYRLTADQRIGMLAEEGSFSEIAADLISADPLKFDKHKPYKASLIKAMEESGLNDAVKVGTCSVGRHEVALGVMDFRFIGGSMGSVVGEKITRLAEKALEDKVPLVIVTASGGARMQEGMYSLMQMAKTNAIIGRLKQTGLPYVSILTNPTTGGVTASFATAADIILAEPKALIGFAGPRVIQQTIGQRLPKDFQSAEFLLERGFVDKIVHRTDLKKVVVSLLGYLTGNGNA